MRINGSVCSFLIIIELHQVDRDLTGLRSLRGAVFHSNCFSRAITSSKCFQNLENSKNSREERSCQRLFDPPDVRFTFYPFSAKQRRHFLDLRLIIVVFFRGKEPDSNFCGRKLSHFSPAGNCPKYFILLLLPPANGSPLHLLGCSYLHVSIFIVGILYFSPFSLILECSCSGKFFSQPGQVLTDIRSFGEGGVCSNGDGGSPDISRFH